MIVRDEHAADGAAIHAMTREAFATMPFSHGDEAELVDALRAAGALRVSLVAEAEGAIAGHIGFSPVEIEWRGGEWFASPRCRFSPTGSDEASVRRWRARGWPGSRH